VGLSLHSARFPGLLRHRSVSGGVRITRSDARQDGPATLEQCYTSNATPDRRPAPSSNPSVLSRLPRRRLGQHLAAGSSEARCELMPLVKLCTDLHMPLDQTLEIPIVSLEGKRHCNVGGRIEQLRGSDCGRDVGVTGHQYRSIAASLAEELEEFARDGDVGFLLLMRPI
jgi:hypothetical protein